MSVVAMTRKGHCSISGIRHASQQPSVGRAPQERPSPKRQQCRGGRPPYSCISLKEPLDYRVLPTTSLDVAFVLYHVSE